MEPLYYPPFKLHDYQARFAAYCYERKANLLAADTGMGKSHIAMAVMCMLFEDDMIDHVLIECETNKLWEWYDDLSDNTKLEAVRYVGDVKKRAKIREDLPQVIWGTFETFRNDLADKFEMEGKKGKLTVKLIPGPLLEKLTGKRVLVIGDEAPAKMGAVRTSVMYKVHELTYKILRAASECRVLIMSATPMDRDPETYFNLGRLLIPEQIGTVAKFEQDHVVARDQFGRVVQFKNLQPDLCDYGVTSLREKMAPVLLSKSKKDPDVAHLFPEMPEPDYTFVRLDARHQDFYETVADTFADSDPWTEQAVWTVLRQIAGHPLSLLKAVQAADSRKNAKIPETASTIVREVGEAGLRALGSAKLEALVTRLKVLVRGQGAQVVAFTFFGQSILPLIHERLMDEGFKVSINHGQMSSDARGESQRTFRAGGTEIFLSSDAGARGLNLPEAQYVENYEAPLTASNMIQRINRINRLSSQHEIIFAHTLVAKGTLEEGIVKLGLKRHGWHDDLIEDDEDGSLFLNAAQRRQLLKIRRAAA